MNRDLSLVVRANAAALSLVPAVRGVVGGIDPELPMARVQTMDQIVARSLRGRRNPTVLLGAFGAVALALVVLGTYAVLAFGVTQRVRELGIRQALGADDRAIFGDIIARGLRAVGVGIALGLMGTVALTRYLQGLLFGVQPLDIPTIAGVCVLLVVAAMLASLVAARRAARVDPLVALRTD